MINRCFEAKVAVQDPPNVAAWCSYPGKRYLFCQQIGGAADNGYPKKEDEPG